VVGGGVPVHSRQPKAQFYSSIANYGIRGGMNLEIRGPVLNAEVGESSLALCSLESVISKFRIGFRVSNFQPRLSSPGNLRLTVMPGNPPPTLSPRPSS
jgi:hypothetical protein